MKKWTYLLFIFCSITALSKPDSLTIRLDYPNTLKAKIHHAKLDSVRSLTLTGIIDQRDISYLATLLPYLSKLDMTDVQIAAYQNYPENYFPAHGFSRKQNTELSRFVERQKEPVQKRELFDKHHLDLILPKSLLGIGAYAFSIPYITRIQLHEGIKVINEGAFSTLRIEELQIPRSVTTIKSEALSFLPNLKKLTFEEGSQLEILDDSLGFYHPFLSIDELTELDLSPCTRLKKIGNFISGNQLKRIILPPNIETIYIHTWGCPSLDILELRSTTPPDAHINRLPKQCVVIVPQGTMNVYKEHPFWKRFTIKESLIKP